MKYSLLSFFIMLGFGAYGQVPCETPTFLPPTPVIVCEGTGIMLAVGAYPKTSNITYKWKKEGSDNILSEWDTLFIIPIHAEDDGKYYVEVDYGCGTWQSEKVRVTVVKPIMPAVSIYCDPVMFEGQAATVNVVSTIGAGPNPLYHYYYNGLQQLASPSESFHFVVGLGANNVHVTMLISVGECVFSNNADASIIVTGVKKAEIVTKDTLISENFLLIEATPPTFGHGVWRVLNGTGIFDDSLNATTVIRQLPAMGETKIVWQNSIKSGQSTFTTSDTIHIGTTGSLGMDKQENIAASFGPNPTEGTLSISLTNDLTTRISLYTLTGKEVQHWTCNRNAQLELSDEFPKGTYLLKFQNERGVRVDKVVKR